MKGSDTSSGTPGEATLAAVPASAAPAGRVDEATSQNGSKFCKAPPASCWVRRRATSRQARAAARRVGVGGMATAADLAKIGNSPVISASVGRGGRNKPVDVAIMQFLLNDCFYDDPTVPFLPGRRGCRGDHAQELGRGVGQRRRRQAAEGALPWARLRAADLCEEPPCHGIGARSRRRVAGRAGARARGAHRLCHCLAGEAVCIRQKWQVDEPAPFHQRQRLQPPPRTADHQRSRPGRGDRAPCHRLRSADAALRVGAAQGG